MTALSPNELLRGDLTRKVHKAREKCPKSAFQRIIQHYHSSCKIAHRNWSFPYPLTSLKKHRDSKESNKGMWW